MLLLTVPLSELVILRLSTTSVVVESNEFKSKSESSWLISDLGIYVAREPKNANFEKCNHRNLSTLKTVVTKLGLSHMQ